MRSPLLRVNPRSIVAMVHDLAWTAALWLGLFALRYQVDFRLQITPEIRHNALMTLPVVLGIHLACYRYFGLYRGIWRYASLHDLRRIALAIAAAGVLVPTVMLLWRWGIGVPRSLYLLHPLLLLLFLCGGRILYRWWKEELPWALVSNRGKPVLLLTHGQSMLSLVDEFRRSENWRLVGVLDDTVGSHGRSVAGVPVLGTWDELPQFAGRYGASHAVLGDSAVDHLSRRRAFEICERAHVKLMLMPRIDDLMSGQVRFSQARDVELDDLLGRDPVALDIDGVSHLLHDHVVLVTGAGGTIGSELVRQVVAFRPSLLVLYEQSEFALYALQQELEQRSPDVAVRCVIGDVKEQAQLEQVFARYRPRVVFHAAAYKHVPLMEEENAWAAVRNNALGTWRVADVAGRYPVEKLVFVSTDKAVNPTSVMGASKRLAEMLLQQLTRASGVPTVIVRFGNVLGSTGSVVPKFKAQIARGGPITVTHPEITRYFMSVGEAAQLVLQSALMGQSGEVFVLEMGRPVRIVDLARDLIRLSGLTEEDIRIRFTGLRPGEKLYEELLANAETTLATRHPKLRIAKATRVPDERWSGEVMRWLVHETMNEAETKRGLAAFVPEYQPFSATGPIAPPALGVTAVADARDHGDAAERAADEHASVERAGEPLEADAPAPAPAARVVALRGGKSASR